MKNVLNSQKRRYYAVMAPIALILSLGISHGVGMPNQSVCSIAEHCYSAEHVKTMGDGSSSAWGAPIVYKKTADFKPYPGSKMTAPAHFTVIDKPFYAFVNFVFWMGLAGAVYAAYEIFGPKTKNNVKNGK